MNDIYVEYDLYYMYAFFRSGNDIWIAMYTLICLVMFFVVRYVAILYLDYPQYLKALVSGSNISKETKMLSRLCSINLLCINRQNIQTRTRLNTSRLYASNCFHLYSVRMSCYVPFSQAIKRQPSHTLSMEVPSWPKCC